MRRALGLGLVFALAACSSDGSGDAPSSGGSAGASGSGGSSSGGSAGASGAGGSGGQAGSAGSAGSGGASGSSGAGGACSDACPAPAGVKHGCETRFMLGANWAWNQWGADFGGISAWGAQGVSAAPSQFSDAMAAMKAKGVNVIRWWMFPRFLSDGVTFGSDGAPSAVSSGLLADVAKALELADQHDVYLMLTPFSFDNFHPTAVEGGINSRSLEPIVTNAALRKKLLDNLMQPVAQAVESSPYRSRMIAWDLINEPEWAVSGPNENGGEAFDADASLDQISHAQMETFLKELAALLRANSSSLISVGGAAIKWYDAWLDVDQDFYMYHYYDWVYQYYPYTSQNPTTLGLTKPVVIGEFPNAGLSAVGTADQVLEGLWQNGFAGGLTWAYNDNAFPWSTLNLKSFSDQHSCETAYTQSGAPAAGQNSAPAASGAPYQIDAGALREWLEIRELVDQGRIGPARARATRLFRDDPGNPAGPAVFRLTGVHPRPALPR